ncbi:hypothetical protein PIB30_074485 [Stylosanthes scabra]|uniref:Uncharacterized protein n=1 Tax=Stylosanthes scabra TaxID=79078 RepID=A0ABU6QPT3_9FABA|nr:hypothetical protein [Stylosanthes scabra]
MGLEVFYNLLVGSLSQHGSVEFGESHVSPTLKRGSAWLGVALISFGCYVWSLACTKPKRDLDGGLGSLFVTFGEGGSCLGLGLAKPKCDMVYAWEACHVRFAMKSRLIFGASQP